MGGLLRGSLGVFGRTSEAEMGSEGFHWRRKRVEIVDRGLDVRGRGQARLRFDGRRCLESFEAWYESSMRDGEGH